jgi:hypothetical protein
VTWSWLPSALQELREEGEREWRRGWVPKLAPSVLRHVGSWPVSKPPRHAERAWWFCPDLTGDERSGTLG